MKHPIDLSAIAAAVAPTQTMIKTRLNKGCKAANARDIIAAAQGIKDYDTAVGLAKQGFYSARANLGSASAPCWITKELGYFEHEALASAAMMTALKDCQQFVTWSLFRDETDLFQRHHSRPQGRGLFVQLTVQGDTQGALDIALEQAASAAEQGQQGYVETDDAWYQLERSGEPCSFCGLDERGLLAGGEPWVVLEQGGIIEGFHDADEHPALKTELLTGVPTGSPYWVFARQSGWQALDQAVHDNDDSLFWAIDDRHRQPPIQGTAAELLERLYDEPRCVVIYRELERYNAPAITRTKIARGWYRFNDIHVVETERYGNDKVLDWVAVRGRDVAERIYHGNSLEGVDILWAGNRLRDYPGA